MKQRYWILLTAVLLLALLGSAFVIFDTAMSLEDSRSRTLA